MGIPKEKLAELFQPFNQLDASIAPKFGGTGLGLSIVQGLARAMGGDVAVDSQKDKGTAFTLHLPFGQVDAASVAQVSSVIVSGQTRVLVAEDDELNQWILKEMLDHCEASVQFVSSGDDALQVLEREKFDLLLIDQNMPGLDGLSTVARIRDKEQKESRERMPAILISGDTELGPSASRHGLDACLFKPFEFEALKNIMKLARQAETSTA